MQFIGYRRLAALAAGLFAFFCAVPAWAGTGTVTGTVDVPTFDTGYKPSWNRFRVRVMGTDIRADLDSGYSYTLPDVPEGPVTLILDQDREPTDVGDWFTRASRTTDVTVQAGLTVQANLSPVPHWQEIDYPPVHGQAGYAAWKPQFVSASVGFILYKVNPGGGVTGYELWRTTDAGGNWAKVTDWAYDESAFTQGTNYPHPELIFHFHDADHGIVQATGHSMPCSGGVGFFYTNNGGQSWGYGDLPNPGTSYSLNAQRLDSFSEGHYVVAGTSGCNVQGYGGGFWDVIWESTDGGSTWQSKVETETSTGANTLALFPTGDAVAFYTPYGVSASRRYFFRDGQSGQWSGPVSDVTLSFTNGTVMQGQPVANSGINGAADMPVFGNSAYVQAEGYAPARFYRTDDFGHTWQEVSTAAPQYMSFADEQNGFGLFGGPAYVTRDGGVTWLRQADGAGAAGHGNDVWAFARDVAYWHTSAPQLLAFADPEVERLEAVPGVALPDWYAVAGETNLAAASFRIVNRGTADAAVSGLTLADQRPVNAARAVKAVKLWLDADQDGYAGTGDTVLASGVYRADGTLALTFAPQTLRPDEPLYLLVTYDLRQGVPSNVKFVCELAPAAITATAGGQPLAASAPQGHAVVGRSLLTGVAVLDEHFASLAAWNATSTPTASPAPWSAEAGVGLGQGPAAIIRGDRSIDSNNGLHNYLTLNASLDTSAAGAYKLQYMERASLQPNIYGRTYTTLNGGSSWQPLAVIGDFSAGYGSGGKFVGRVFDLPVTSSTPTFGLRFDADWSSGSYYAFDWTLDDLRVVRLTTGTATDDFETGNLNKWPWAGSGVSDWSVVSDTKYQGSFSACSGAVGNGQESNLNLEVDGLGGEVSFYRRVSSRQYYDYLSFLVDGVQKASWSGSYSFAKQTYVIPSGRHTLTWRYKRANSTPSYEDRGCIDLVTIPTSAEATALPLFNPALNLLLLD